MTDRQTPPPLAKRLAGRALDGPERPSRLGDLEERYAYLVRDQGPGRARAWYRKEALRLFSLAFINDILWSFPMFKNNLIVAWRNIRKGKAHSALNILGLAAGLAVFILIMLYVRTELGYDRYHAEARNIYRVIRQQSGNEYMGSDVFAVTPPSLAPALAREFPEVRTAARIDFWDDVLVGVGDKSFMEERVYWADPGIFDIFTLPLVRGNKTALEDPSSILLSEREARRLFGAADPVGRALVLRAFGMTSELKVAGVFRDMPAGSHFVMNAAAPFETMARLEGRDLTRWGGASVHTFVLLRDGADARALDAKLPTFIDKYSGGKAYAFKGRQARYLLEPLTRIHLHSRANFDLAPASDARIVSLIASIAVIVLAIACVNYMNLAAVRSLNRTREVGLRRVIGAGRGQIVRQFLGDSLLLTYGALVLAAGLVAAVLPAFRSFVERPIAFSPFHDVPLAAGLVLLAAVVGLAAGSYPAFFASSFRPAAALKGTGAFRRGGRGLRSALIVFQFAVSITLIICAIGVRNQLRFIRTADMGYGRDQILVLTPRGGVATGLEAFEADLRRKAAVRDVAASRCLPDNVDSITKAGWPGKPEGLEIPIYVMEAGYNFVDTYGLEVIRGRNFSRDYPSDAGGAILINESAQKALGWDDPIGRELYHFGNKNRPGKVVGVVKNFHMRSLHHSIEPLYIYLDPKSAAYVSVKLRGGDLRTAVSSIREAWKRFEPDYPFEYAFFDEIFDRAYRNDLRMGTIFGAFAGLAVFIACLGLVGLVSFAAERKTKEIGIRKVLGASSPGVVVLLSREFMKWVVLANFIGWPAGYFAMHAWLGSFAYRTRLTPAVFLGAGLTVFAIAAAVLGLRTYRAAAADPVNSIRYE